MNFLSYHVVGELYLLSSRVLDFLVQNPPAKHFMVGKMKSHVIDSANPCYMMYFIIMYDISLYMCDHISYDKPMMICIYIYMYHYICIDMVY